jgi:hypothetical protein
MELLTLAADPESAVAAVASALGDF